MSRAAVRPASILFQRERHFRCEEKQARAVFRRRDLAPEPGRCSTREGTVRES